MSKTKKMTSQQQLLTIINQITSEKERSEDELYDELIKALNKAGVSFSEYEVVSALEVFEKTKRNPVIHNLKLMLSE